MSHTVTANPFRCRMWELHDRLENHVTEHSCTVEIRSIASHGQLIPALARALKGDPDYDYELIYGARRLFVARHLNIGILLEVREMSDTEAIVAMDIENRHRKDISVYERGMSYARWLRSGFFSSQEELARKLKNSPAAVSRALKLASLPSVIVNAFADATEIRESWGVSLADALEDPKARARLIAAARTIRTAKDTLNPEQVYRTLISASLPGRKSGHSPADEVVRDSTGSLLFRVKHQRHSIAFVFPLQKLPPRAYDSVRRALLGVLQREASRPQDGNGSSAGDAATGSSHQSP